MPMTTADPARERLGRIRRRLEVQGFLGLSDDDVLGVGRWVRFTPACNLVLVSAATAARSVIWLLGLAVLMAVGALTPAHPFDLLYNTLVRRFTGTRGLPKSSPRRKFTFVVGALWLGAVAAAFAGGHRLAGYLLGALMVAAIVPLATVGVCVLSETMERLLGPARPAAD
jgi:Domain of unknown function (DUF4395)